MENKVPANHEGSDPGANNSAENNNPVQLQHSLDTPGDSAVTRGNSAAPAAIDSVKSYAAAENADLPDQIISDGSASAFEGTELTVDSDPKNKFRKRPPDDASGISNY